MRCFTMLAFIILTLPVFAQKENKFRVEYDGRPYLVMHASETPIILPTKRCYEQIDPDLYTIEHSKNFLIVRIYDEMQNGRGILLFDTTGKQINFDKVTAVRKKYYKHADCCVYVSEYKSDLIFWEGTNSDGDDYDCSYDSQSDGYDNIPRYYIFNPKTNHVETKVLEKPCPQLFEKDKIICR